MLTATSLIHYVPYINFTYLLQDLGIQATGGATNEIMTLCPNPLHNDTKPSFGISTKTGMFHCFGCNFHGGVLSLVKFMTQNDNTRMALEYISKYLEGSFDTDIENIIPFKKREQKFNEEEDAKVGIHEIRLPKGYVRYTNEISWYLQSKGIDHKLIQNTFDIGYCYGGNYIGRMAIPIYFNSILVMVQARAVIPDIEPKDKFTWGIKKQYIYNYDNLEKDEFLIITESPLDVFRIYPFYKNVTCLFGAKVLPEQAELILNKSKHIGIMPDADSGFQVMLQSAMQYLYHKTEMHVSTINKNNVPISINMFKPISTYLKENWRYLDVASNTKSMFK